MKRIKVEVIDSGGETLFEGIFFQKERAVSFLKHFLEHGEGGERVLVDLVVDGEVEKTMVLPLEDLSLFENENMEG